MLLLSREALKNLYQIELMLKKLLFLNYRPLSLSFSLSLFSSISRLVLYLCLPFWPMCLSLTLFSSSFSHPLCFDFSHLTLTKILYHSWANSNKKKMLTTSALPYSLSFFSFSLFPFHPSPIFPSIGNRPG